MYGNNISRPNLPQVVYPNHDGSYTFNGGVHYPSGGSVSIGGSVLYPSGNGSIVARK